MDDIVLARVVGAHGLKGDVALKIFAEEPNVLLRHTFKQGRVTALKKGPKDVWIAKFENVNDRNASEVLIGAHLTVARDALPPLNTEEFYLTDLKGLAAIANGQPVGRVLDVVDFGAGLLLDIGLNTGRGLFLPFEEPYCGAVDLAAKTIEISEYEHFL